MADFPATVNVSALNGSDGFTITAGGVSATGITVSSAGDVNGDGVEDFVIGIDGSPANRAYVLFGDEGGFPSTLALSGLDGTNGFWVTGETTSDRAGGSVGAAGDFNNDGYDDIIVGARGNDPGGVTNAGSAYIVLGGPSPATGGLGSAFKLSGVVSEDLVGWSVAGIGDINGDGFDDVLVGAKYADINGSSSGAAYVVFGHASPSGVLDLSTLDGANGFRIGGVAAIDLAGYSVGAAGDVNGDGIDDLVIGATGVDSANAGSGAAYVVFGSADEPFDADLDLSALNGSNGFRIAGTTTNEYVGFSVASAGDINGDGFDDLAVGGRGSGGTGGVSIIFGSNAGFAATLSVTDLNGTNGFRIAGEAGADHAGRSVSAAGDLNGDGIDDLIIGAPQADPNGSSSGAAYVVFGSRTGFGATLALSSLDGSNGFQINGAAANDRAGWSVSSADINGDGNSDIIIGARLSSGAGAAYVIYGLPPAPVVEVGTGANDAYVGGGAADDLSGAGGDDTLEGLTGDDLLNGGDGKDRLYGGLGADDLVGGIGGDLLDGGEGADEMAGGAGDDTYVVDDLGDTITDTSGVDRVRAGITYTLGADVENLQLTGTADIDGVGNAGANQIDGNSGANTLNGGGGNDVIRGAGGLDTLEGESGADQLLGGDGDDLLYGGDANDVLQGGADADTLHGGAGVDTLDGGTGEDVLNGDAGNDRLDGGDADDALFGGADNDQLTGGAGADILTGGIGDDTYIVTDYLDILVEAVGEGNDIVRSTVTWGLADNFERLVLEGTSDIDGSGNDQANQITGNSGANLLFGGNGADTLNGGLGNDEIIGGAGNDILIGGGGADVFFVQIESISPSTDLIGALETDTISDYVIGQDSIDFSDVDADISTNGIDEALTFGAFDGTAGRISLSFSGGITTVLLDVDGDRNADYRLRINGDVTADTAGWVL
ncbi:hypothetical protein GVN21_14530 [Caulobacter sp. SLTY]|uniref:beta strand repeat-containing protein n=1 Tax=Caulobacter sp. SLTY TaxID=2683262 RepID=UPI001411F17E|nr:FG-GAP repeat protein [Caulobacter sp. SLTY]NBB16576.1 hypothetical protein [Caulobacter sp. SLTY]